MSEWKPDRSGKYLTVVYRDLIPGDEVGEVIDHPKAVIMSWSNAVDDVQQLSNTTPPQHSATARKPLTATQAQDIVEFESWGPDAISLNARLLRTIRRTEAAHGITSGTDFKE